MNNAGYIIKETLNQSSTTTVHTAFHAALNRTVLLKVLQKHLVTDRDFVERFTREARACALLRSEHIVQVYDLTEIDGAPAIVMEYVDGPSLKVVLEKEGPQTIEFVRRAGVHVLRALVVAHKHQIVHRDIKPGNILLAPSNVVKVTDFGLATIPLSPTVTVEGMVLGTPAYMSPEQIHGEVLDQRTDLFSLGVTLVELLSGVRMFEGASYSECIKKILLFDGTTLPLSDRGVPQDFVLFLHRLLDPDADGRFKTAEEALAALGEDMPAPVIPVPVKPAKRFGKSIALLAAGLVVIAIAATIFLMPGREPILRSTPARSIKEDTAAITIREPHDSTPSIPPVSLRVPLKTEAHETIQSSAAPAGGTIADSGTLRIVSTPWAKVYVNNRYIGETPFSSPVKIGSGPCVVTFNNPSFSPIVKNVTIRSNEELLVAADFLAMAGYLSVRAAPWAEVYVDDQYRETTPLTQPLIVSAGPHRVRLHNPAYADLVEDVTVKSRDTSRVAVTYEADKKK
jgi:serine/threonine protein kinase